MKMFEDIAAEQFKVPRESVRDSMTSKDVPEWDSMNYLLFISELEKEYNISFTMDEVLGAQTLGDLRRILKARGVDV